MKNRQSPKLQAGSCSSAAGAAPLYDGNDLAALAKMPRYHGWIMHHFRPYLGGAAAEFGAGSGTISEKLLPFVTTLDLIEPSPNLVAQLRQKFAGREAVTIFAESLESHIERQPPGSYDSVILVNVLEHIEDDRAAIEGFARLLKPGGRLLLFVPALPFLYSPLDALVGHYRRYTRGALTEMLADAGFSVPLARYMDLLGIIPWWLLNKVARQTKFNPILVRLYDAFGIPLTRFAEGLFTPPAGKNIIAVAEKRG